MINSKIVRMYAPEDLRIPEELEKITVTPAEVRERIARLQEEFLQILPADGAVRAGDFVELGHGRDKLTLNTGFRFSHTALCRAAEGKRIADAVEDESGALWRITGIKRRTLPAFDASLVEKACIEGVTTPSQYTEYVRDGIIAAKEAVRLNEAAEQIAAQMKAQCGYVIDTEDIAAVRAENENSVRELMEETEMTRDEAVRSLLEMFGVEAGEPVDADRALDSAALDMLRTIALGSRILQNYGVTDTGALYKKFIADTAKEEGLDAQAARAAYGEGVFLYGKCTVQIATEAKNI